MTKKKIETERLQLDSKTADLLSKAGQSDKYLELHLDYDPLIDKTTDLMVKSKEQANMGIELVTKGTLLKMKSEKMLAEAREILRKSEEIFVHFEETKTEAENRRAKAEKEREEYNALAQEAEATFKKYEELKEKMNHKVYDAEVDESISNTRFVEAKNLKTRYESLNIKGNSMLDESKDIFKNALRMIDDGNALIEDSKRTTNISKDALGATTEQDFNLGIVDLRKTNETDVPASEMEQDMAGMSISTDTPKKRKGLFGKK